MKRKTLLILFKSGLPRGASLQTGKRGGKYYESGGKKIYVGKGEYKTKYAQAMHEKISSMVRLDDITTSIFHVDKLVNEGKILAEEVDQLYQAAENQMRTLQGQVSAAKEKKEEKRKAIVTRKRAKKEYVRKERKAGLTKKYNEKIIRMKKRVARWKNISGKLDGIEHKTNISKNKIQQKYEEIKPAIDKLKEKKGKLKLAAQKIVREPGKVYHPQFPKLVAAIKKFKQQSAHIKNRIAKLKEASNIVSDKLRRIKAIKAKAQRIVKNYIKEASELKEVVFG